jgi:hypothetical protein
VTTAPTATAEYIAREEAWGAHNYHPLDLVIAEASVRSYKQLLRQTVLSGRTWAQPVLANKRIYVRDNQGNMACVGL